MLLVVGLGNPGREYENDRHNVGFMVVDALQRAWSLPDFREKFHARLCAGEGEGKPLALLEPQTFMNLSGDAVQPAAAFFKVAPGEVIVVHDELDLPWGDVRVKVGGGHAGHNGVRHLIQRLGTPDFVRVRIGVGKPAGGTTTTRDWVLGAFDAAQRAELPGVIDRAVVAVRRIVADGVDVAMRSVNVR